MRVPALGRTAAVAAAVVLLAACSAGGSTPTPSPAGNGDGGSGGGSASGAPATSQAPGGGGGTGADAGSLNACNFLTTDQIQAAVGWAVGAGVVQNSDGQTDCEWSSSANDGGSVGLTISNYDDSLFRAGASAGNSTAVSGIGEAAFKGWPHAGDLTIKYKGYQVAVAIIDFKATNTKVDGETLALAQLVLPKL